MWAVRPLLVFDSETVPDPDTARRVLGDGDLSDEEALARVLPARADGQGFLKPLYQRVVAVAVAWIDETGDVRQFKPLDAAKGEGELLGAFWDGFARLVAARPPARLVTFNGRGFDLPVFVQRGLIHGVSPAAWWNGDYRQRFRDSHIDLMDVLRDYGSSPALSQQEVATMLGLPGKLGVAGADVHALWRAGRLEDVAAYCACDVATLTLSFARVGVHAGWLTEEERRRVEAGMRRELALLAPTHHLYAAFLEALGA